MGQKIEDFLKFTVCLHGQGGRGVKSVRTIYFYNILHSTILLVINKRINYVLDLIFATIVINFPA